MENLTSKDLESLGVNPKVAEVWLPYFKSILPSFKINTNERVAGFIAQALHETGCLTKLEENLNYSAEGLANTWPKRYAKKLETSSIGDKTLQNGLYAKNPVGRYLPSDKALKLARKPVLIASDCYANRMGNGPVESQEGWKFRGRGIFQLTGKSNYAALMLDTGIDFVSNPDLLIEPAYALISACWFWNKNNLNKFADMKDIKGLSIAINGGEIGLTHRVELFNKLLLLLKG